MLVVEDILAEADMINHATLIFPELNNAVSMLTNKGFLSLHHEGIALTEKVRALLEKWPGQSLSDPSRPAHSMPCRNFSIDSMA